MAHQASSGQAAGGSAAVGHVVTGEAGNVLVPPRLLLLNGPWGIGIREAAEVMRARWPAVVLDAEELGLLALKGLPPGPRGERLDDLAVWRRVLAQVAATLAHAYPPVVVVTMTLTRRYDYESLARELAARKVQFAHVVVTEAEDALRSRIHARGGDPDARRWALSRAHEATADLAAMPADDHVDATGRDPGQLAQGVLHSLVRLGWLDDTGRWAPGQDGRRHG